MAYSLFLEYGLCILMWERKRWPPLYGRWSRGGCSRSLLQGGPSRDVGAVLAGVTGHGEAPLLAVKVSCPKAGEKIDKVSKYKREKSMFS